MFFTPFHVLLEREAPTSTGSNLSGDWTLRSKSARFPQRRALQSWYNLKDQTIQAGIFSSVNLCWYLR